jgi:hypothetical protein
MQKNYFLLAICLVTFHVSKASKEEPSTTVPHTCEKYPSPRPSTAKGSLTPGQSRRYVASLMKAASVSSASQPNKK